MAANAASTAGISESITEVLGHRDESGVADLDGVVHRVGDLAECVGSLRHRDRRWAENDRRGRGPGERFQRRVEQRVRQADARQVAEPCVAERHVVRDLNQEVCTADLSGASVSPSSITVPPTISVHSMSIGAPLPGVAEPDERSNVRHGSVTRAGVSPSLIRTAPRRARCRRSCRSRRRTAGAHSFVAEHRCLRPVPVPQSQKATSAPPQHEHQRKGHRPRP